MYLVVYSPISTHSLLAEGDKTGTESRPSRPHFNPLPPRGGRRTHLKGRYHHGLISTHSLLAEGDGVRHTHGQRQSKISTHSLLAEGDMRPASFSLQKFKISTHSLLAEGDSKTRQSFSPSIGEILQTHFFFFVPRTLFSSFSIKKVAFSGANLPGFSCLLPVRTRASHHQHIVRLISGTRADMLHLGAIIIPKDVKAQAVSIRINQSGQFCFQQAQLRCVQRTLEH